MCHILGLVFHLGDEKTKHRKVNEPRFSLSGSALTPVPVSDMGVAAGEIVHSVHMVFMSCGFCSEDSDSL